VTAGQAPPRATDAATDDDSGHRFEDLTCDLSAEPIAAAMGLQSSVPRRDREGLIDNNPTLESPPPQPVMRGSHLARSFSSAAAEPQFWPSKPATAPKAARPAVKRAPAVPDQPPPTRAPSIRPIARAPAPVVERVAEPLIETLAATSILPPEPMPMAAPAIEPPVAPVEAIEPAVPLGQLLHGRYELELLLGRGGMASVYKAIDHHRARLGLADQIVAVKVVHATASRPATPAALIQEFQSAQRLSHPNVINVFDIDQDADSTFYSMELLSGARLSQLLRRVDGTVLQRCYALAIIRDIGAAVAHAHARGVVHADLKPSNVMITQDGDVRVLDFGGSSMPPREPWVSAGDGDDAYHHATPAYASCEQLERRRADPRDDIYAIACIAYLLLAGKHPFDYLSSIEARSRALQARRPAGMPLRQWRVLRQGLAWGRASQPAAIEPWLAGLGLSDAVSRLPPLAELTAAAQPSSPWLRPILTGAVAIAVAAGVGVALSNANVDWHDTLNAGIDGAQRTLQKTLHAFDANEAAQTAASAPAAQTAASAPAAQTAASAPAAQTAATAPAAQNAATAPPAAAAARGASSTTAGALTTASTSAATAAPAAQGPPHVAFASESYRVGAADPAARIVIARTGSAQGDLNFIWWTEGGSAEPEVDYASLGARTEHLASGEDRLTVYVPIISNPLRRNSSQFQVVLADAASHRGNSGAQNAHATVTIEGNR
jgi:hypothetical protein